MRIGFTMSGSYDNHKLQTITKNQLRYSGSSSAERLPRIGMSFDKAIRRSGSPQQVSYRHNFHLTIRCTNHDNSLASAGRLKALFTYRLPNLSCTWRSGGPIHRVEPRRGLLSARQESKIERGWNLVSFCFSCS